VSEINLNNYEAYMLDYFDGTLSPEQIVALKAFAILHPELDLNFDDELVSLEMDSHSFNGKQHLKANFSDELVIGYLENVLSEKEKTQADELAIQNPLFISELSLYKKTIAQPENTIVFENKALLKHQPKVIAFNWSVSLRIAAALLLVAGIWLILSKTFTSETLIIPELASDLEKQNNNSLKPSQTDQTKESIGAATIEKKLAYSTSSKKNSSTAPIENNTVTNNTDTLSKNATENQLVINSDSVTNEKQVRYLDTNSVKLANHVSKEATHNITIIEEGTDDEATVAAAPKKKTLWGFAAKALNKLNQKGIENVNGSESGSEIFIGALTISKN